MNTEKQIVPQLMGRTGASPVPLDVSSSPPCSATRDHSAFLSSYAPQDEGIYNEILFQ